MRCGELGEEVQAQLVQALKVQYVQMLQCHMLPVDASFYFINKFYTHAKSFASTAVVVKAKHAVVRSYVHIKRDVKGDLMSALILDGPSYMCEPGCCDQPVLAAVTRHASEVLFRVYTKLLYAAQSPTKVVLEQSFPPTSNLPPGVAAQPYSELDVVQRVLPRLVSSLRPPTPNLSPVASEVCAAPAAVEMQEEQEGEAGPRRKRAKRGTSSCYICWRKRPCDILFPCRRHDHACCRRCIVHLFEMWSSTEFDGVATMKCPQCACATGLVTTVQGQVVWLGTRYALRKQRRKSYVESDSD